MAAMAAGTTSPIVAIMRRADAGFSLLELLLALSILALLAGLAVPRVQGARRAVVAEESMRRFVAALADWQEQAERERAWIRLMPRAEGSAWRVERLEFPAFDPLDFRAPPRRPDEFGMRVEEWAPPGIASGTVGDTLHVRPRRWACASQARVIPEGGHAARIVRYDRERARYVVEPLP